MSMSMKATPLGSAIPALAKQDPKVEVADYQATTADLKEAAERPIPTTFNIGGYPLPRRLCLVATRRSNS
jgi:hypothetical protein